MKGIIGAEAAILAGLQIDTLQKVRSGSITLDQWEQFNNLSAEDREEFFGKRNSGKKKENLILRLLSEGEDIIIPACDGSATLAQAKETFLSYIDSDLKNWGLDKAGIATEKTTVQVYELVKDATFAQMFGSIGVDLDKLCLTQHQIKTFCEKHTKWLRTNDNATLFLFKEGGQVVVTAVSMCPDGLYVYFRRFEVGRVWNADYWHRLVVPQPAV